VELKEKNQYKSDFKKELDKFSEKHEKYVSSVDGGWTIKGFTGVYKNIYTISSDTKIVSKILEIHICPQILQFAQSIGYKIILAEKQNWHRDLTFVDKENDEVKFALDIKTTFRSNHKTAGFTLGSHGGYFKERDKDKNFRCTYNHYTGHYCLGVIYTRTDITDNLAETEIFQVKDLEEEYQIPDKKVGLHDVTTVDNLKSITSVIKNFDFFEEQKWEISSDKQGSGNTANIGSVVDVDILRNGNVVFSQLGEEWFDEYRINHGSASMIKNGKPAKITNLKDFLEFKGRGNLLEKIVIKSSKIKAK